MKKSITKPKNVNYTRVPSKLWSKLKKYLPKLRQGGRGRPACNNRAVLNGIWYVLWTGCQWKAMDKTWFGVSSSVIHARFQAWAQQGVFVRMMAGLLRYYGRVCHIRWTWQAGDSRSVPAPLGGKGTGPNPTDRAKSGGKVHILVDQRGAPLAVDVFGTNQLEKWHIAALISMILIHRPTQTQHLCLDKGYDSWEVHIEVKQQGYIAHIKHHRRVNEPKDVCPIPGKTQFPPRRWVVERTFAWIGWRRSIRTRWCKKPQNWPALMSFLTSLFIFRMSSKGL